jgi:hypothetical protein
LNKLEERKKLAKVMSTTSAAPALGPADMRRRGARRARAGRNAGGARRPTGAHARHPGGRPVDLGEHELLAGVEGARAAAARGRPLGLMAEWLGAALWAAAASGLVFVGLLVTLAPTPALAELGLRLAATAAAYPLVALALRVGLRGRPAAGSDGDMMFGRRA